METNNTLEVRDGAGDAGMTPATGGHLPIAVTLSPAAIALNRLGLGARPDDTVPRDPKAWLRDQLDAYEPHPKAVAGLPSTATIAVGYAELRRQANTTNDAEIRQAIQATMRRTNRSQYRAAVNARVANALVTDTPFTERLVHFWANHFAISADKVIVVPFVGSFEAEAIRPHIMGRFEELLFAVEHHAGMILYLDQANSVGPNSARAERARARNSPRVPGLNENLAREIMELHTLGVRSGYTQADVTEFARALTGWSIGSFGAPGPEPDTAPGTFVFRASIHEPGVRTIMGRHYDQSGEEQAHIVMRDLVRMPATSTHIATKLARHFAGDVPPPALVARLAAAFTETNGHLPTIYRVLIDSPDVWVPQPVKFKTPWDWLISALRGIGQKTLDRIQAREMMVELGQSVWEPGSPAGWDDIAASWAAPDALVRRVGVANRLAMLTDDRYDARELAAKLLVSPASRSTQTAIDGADSQSTGLALLLVSPEFQRR
jgi:uncharacterized protein (DUF1800 family)